MELVQELGVKNGITLWPVRTTVSGNQSEVQNTFISYIYKCILNY